MWDDDEWDDDEWDGTVTFEEVSEEVFELFENTFACDVCGWVAYEVRKALGDKMWRWGVPFGGSSFYIKEPKTTDRSIYLAILPVSETEVMVDCVAATPPLIVLSPEKAVEFILSL